jgi:hypothetical protein
MDGRFDCVGRGHLRATLREVVKHPGLALPRLSAARFPSVFEQTGQPQHAALSFPFIRLPRVAEDRERGEVVGATRATLRKLAPGSSSAKRATISAAAAY